MRWGGWCVACFLAIVVVFQALAIRENRRVAAEAIDIAREAVELAKYYRDSRTKWGRI